MKFTLGIRCFGDQTRVFRMALQGENLPCRGHETRNLGTKVHSSFIDDIAATFPQRKKNKKRSGKHRWCTRESLRFYHNPSFFSHRTPLPRHLHASPFPFFFLSLLSIPPHTFSQNPRTRCKRLLSPEIKPPSSSSFIPLNQNYPSQPRRSLTNVFEIALAAWLAGPSPPTLHLP